MVHRLLILTALATIVGTANCSSESVSDLNNRMWQMLDRKDFDGFTNMFASHFRLVPDINVKRDGETPLMYVMDNKIGFLSRRLNWVKFIVNAGAAINETNSAETKTALSEAVVDGSNLFEVKFLVANGALPDLKPRHGDSALSIAFQLNQAGMVRAMVPYSPRQVVESLIAEKRKQIEKLGNSRRDIAAKRLMYLVIYEAQQALGTVEAEVEAGAFPGLSKLEKLDLMAEKKMEAEKEVNLPQLPPPPSYAEAIAGQGAPPAYEEMEKMPSIPGGPK